SLPRPPTKNAAHAPPAPAATGPGVGGKRPGPLAAPTPPWAGGGPPPPGARPARHAHARATRRLVGPPDHDCRAVHARRPATLARDWSCAFAGAAGGRPVGEIVDEKGHGPVHGPAGAQERDGPA